MQGLRRQTPKHLTTPSSAAKQSLARTEASSNLTQLFLLTWKCLVCLPHLILVANPQRRVLRNRPFLRPKPHVHITSSPVHHAFANLTWVKPIHQAQPDTLVHQHPFPWEFTKTWRRNWVDKMNCGAQIKVTYRWAWGLPRMLFLLTVGWFLALNHWLPWKQLPPQLGAAGWM